MSASFNTRRGTKGEARAVTGGKAAPLKAGDNAIEHREKIQAQDNEPAAGCWVFTDAAIRPTRMPMEEVLSLAPTVEKTDGPFPPKGFRWKNIEVDVEPVPWRLINAMWGHEKMKVEELESSVWEDDEFSDNRLKAAIYKANSVFLEAGCSSQISRSGEWVTISS